MRAVKSVKAERGHALNATRELTSQSVKTIFDELTKGQSKPRRKITAMQVANAVAKSVSDLPGVDTETVKQLFLAMTGTVVNHAKATANE